MSSSTTAADPHSSVDAGPEAEPAGGWARWGLELALAAMVVVWGVNFAVAKWALQSFQPLGFNALRYLLASAFVFVVLRSRGPLRRPERRDLPRILLLGFVGNVVYQVAFILGLDHTRAGNASVMLALTPVFVAFLTAVRGHERPGPRTWVGALVSLVGVAMVSGAALQLEGTATLRGDLVLIGAAVVWSIYTVGSRPLIARYGSLRTTVWTLWVGAVGLFFVGLPSLVEQEWSDVGVAAWGGLAFSGLFSIGLAYLIWYWAVGRIGGTRTAVYSNLAPVVALAVGALWLGEALTPLSITGAALVITGVMLVRGDR